MAKVRPGTIEEFWQSNIVVSPGPLDTPCWLWTARLHKDGYGYTCIQSKQWLAHRLGWELNVGPIPSGMQVLHRCDVRACVCPGHLFLGTQLENIVDMVSKGRHKSALKFAARPRGQRHGAAVMTDEYVLDARARKKTAREVMADVAISYQSAWDMVRGRTWRHLLPPTSSPT